MDQGPLGAAGGYHQTHRLYIKTNYASVIGLDGIDEPVHSAFSECDVCGHRFYHASHDFLVTVKLPAVLQTCYVASPPYATGRQASLRPDLVSHATERLFFGSAARPGYSGTKGQRRADRWAARERP